MSDYQWPEDFWPNQLCGCTRVVANIEAGIRRMILTSPTGTGKSRIMIGLIEWARDRGWEVALYTHRRMLLSQLSKVLTKHGIEHGMRASGHETALLKPVQLCMVQTELSAVLKTKRREMHHAQLVISDELHACGGDTLPELHRLHYEEGAAIVGITATPLDIIGDWDDLIVAGTVSQGRDCGALVLAYTYCPDEPDMKHIGRQKIGEDNAKDLTDKQNSNVMFGENGIYRPKVFGRVMTHWLRLNFERKPTILFGPDVAGSLYFAQEFHKNGIRAAHIDAKQIWYNGDFIESNDDNREMILKATETGEVEILCNRFVLREGIDLPHIACAIFACVVGSLRSWIQMGGRALRAHPSTPEVLIIDHGANFRRHGSLNSNRQWELGQSGHKTTGIRIEEIREKPELEPIICQNILPDGNVCSQARLSGPTCPKCGHMSHKRAKMVVQHDGELKLVEGPTYKKHFEKRKPDTEKKWIEMYYRAKSKKWDASFREAIGLFAHENHYWPPLDLPFMPIDPRDRFNKVSTTPVDRLFPANKDIEQQRRFG